MGRHSPSWMGTFQAPFQKEYKDHPWKEKFEGRPILPNRRGRLRIFVVIILLVIAYSKLGPKSDSFTSSTEAAFSTVKTYGNVKSDNKNHFHIISPADKSDANLCKAILSATLLDYPIPTLYNWAGTSDKMDKISGALSYLKSLNGTSDEDLILVVDGFDIWYQLPPQILIDRYHEINQKAERRIHGSTGSSISEDGFRQTIVISTQKLCWPGPEQHISCFAGPDSSLPKYIYGPQTDTISNEEGNEFKRIRARAINAGFIMGPVKDMRALFERANERASMNPDVLGADQIILATIWGEQEYARTLKHNSLSPSQTQISDFPPTFDVENSRTVFIPENNTNYEFGIGLDYAASLSLPTIFSAQDAAFLEFSNSSSLIAAFSSQGITHPNALALEPDVAVLDLPFSSPVSDSSHSSSSSNSNSKSTPDSRFQQLPHSTLPTLLNWAEIPLYTNLWTGITPALIHHNAWQNNLKSMRETTWDQMWFQPHARALLNARLSEPEHPIAVEGRWGRKKKKWFPAPGKATVREKGFGAPTHNLGVEGWMPWGELCGGVGEEEIWRDGLGPYAG